MPPTAPPPKSSVSCPLKRAIVVATITGMFVILAAVVSNCDKLGICPEPLDVQITYPQPLGIVKKDTTVLGTINQELPVGKYLWLLVGFENPNKWWPQGNSSISTSKKRWYKEAVIDINPSDRQSIAVILVDKVIDRNLTEWWDRANKTENWPPIPLPSGDVMDQISVIKGEEDPEVNITDPQREQTVNYSIVVRGTIDGKIPANNYLWLLAGLQPQDQWWPQTGNIIPSDQYWEIPATIGSGPDNLSAGLRYTLVAILVDEEVNREFKNWMNGEHQPIESPSGNILFETSVFKGIG